MAAIDIDPKDWDRLRAVVRWAEARMRSGSGGPPSAPPRPLPAFWAKITAVSDGAHDWTEVYPSTIPPTTWATVPGGRTSAADSSGLKAYSWSGVPAAVDTIVRLVPRVTADNQITLLFDGPGLFPVLVTQSGGAAGSSSTTCSFTYTVKDLGGTQIGTGLTPARPRFANVEYETPGADSYGLAFTKADGTLQLYEAVEERPKITAVTAVTDYRVDGVKFQKKTRAFKAFSVAAESGWTDVHEGTECPEE